MASIGHVIVGIAASRIERSATAITPRRYLSAAAWSLLSLLPDADVVGFAMGVRYEDEWGHRGATHSVAFSLAVAAAIAVTAPWIGRRRLRTGVLAAIVLASHPLLDTLTDGGLGCALFWPFDLTRYFASWRPIPAAPIGLAFFSLQGLLVSAAELVLFAPLLWLALECHRSFVAPDTHRWSASRLSMAVGSLIVAWGVAAYSPAREGLIGIVVREDTVYSTGFSEDGWSTISVGDPPEKVRAAVGTPLRELFFWAPRPAPACFSVHLQDGVIVTAYDREACRARGVVVGQKSDGPPASLGLPESRCWAYSWSPGRRPFRARGVCFDRGVVVDVITQWAREGPDP